MTSWFRDISNSARTSLWTALAENPPLAGRILSLDLQSEPISTLYSGGEVVVPKSLTTRSVDEGGSPHSSDKDGEAGNGEPQLPELRSGATARICDDLVLQFPDVHLLIAQIKIWELSNLTRASITMEHPQNTMYPDNSTVTAFLGRHPQLEMLLRFLPESVDLPVLPRLRYVSTPSFSKGSSTATAAQLPGLEYKRRNSR
ncbi:hypothetical protein B0H13DRAFT_1868175 [Mycena leptocephala]|nr:hypothetical protein B0H13DRAFT_1868175 [Mycena leptocephala]